MRERADKYGRGELERAEGGVGGGSDGDGIVYRLFLYWKSTRGNPLK
jgi:hypothetical protein